MGSLAESIEGRSFDVGRRGYDRRQVDRFLDEIATTIASMEETLRDALIEKREAERRRVGNRQTEESVETAYIAAAEAKQKLLSDAEERASLILRDAEIEAATLLAEPKETAARARKDAEGLLLQAQARLESANGEAEALRSEATAMRDEAVKVAQAQEAAAVEAADRIREESLVESRRVIAEARAEAEAIVSDAGDRASDVYETERRRSIERLAQSRDEYEDLARRLRALKEATGDMLTNALRDHEAIRVVLDGSSIEVR